MIEVEKKSLMKSSMKGNCGKFLIRQTIPSPRENTKNINMNTNAYFLGLYSVDPTF